MGRTSNNIVQQYKTGIMRYPLYELWRNTSLCIVFHGNSSAMFVAFHTIDGGIVFQFPRTKDTRGCLGMILGCFSLNRYPLIVFGSILLVLASLSSFSHRHAANRLYFDTRS